MEGNDTDLSETNYSDTEINYSVEEEESKSQNYQKIEKATKYDKDYIYELVQTRFLASGYSQTAIDYLVMGKFDQRYHYALDNMRFAQNAEAVADYVFNGLDSDLQLSLRKISSS